MKTETNEKVFTFELPGFIDAGPTNFVVSTFCRGRLFVFFSVADFPEPEACKMERILCHRMTRGMTEISGLLGDLRAEVVTVEHVQKELGRP